MTYPLLALINTSLTGHVCVFVYGSDCLAATATRSVADEALENDSLWLANCDND